MQVAASVLSIDAMATVRVALLLCDTPNDDVLKESGNYHAIYTKWLTDSLATYPDSAIARRTRLQVDPYDVVDKKEYPPAERLQHGAPDAYDCVMLTGSKHTAHDTANPFIPPLVQFVRSLASSPAYQHLKLIGICFGHQILSIALGGECVPGHNGWEIGVYGCQLTEEGRYWWTGDVKGQGGGDKVYLEQMHRDHVPSLPPGCTLLLSTPRYPIHSFYKPHPLSTPSRPLAQILTVQGHPEFTPSIVNHVINARAATGVFDEQTVKEARRRAGGKDGTGGEGFGRIGWAVWRVLLQDLPPANS
ncbi:cytoplasmic protein [Cryptococcus neoformans A2-102-5]|nr:cytoplasmic protein [Cryptococcus neoformans var. grubii AD1-83a]OXG50712.1 cytoplasmic protein [Cryptococcus neoformans var. grubii CHC193]OXG92354.1 cytoplasmic protein [Cryptococcus neoformans var. grubii A2-102-5]